MMDNVFMGVLGSVTPLTLKHFSLLSHSLSRFYAFGLAYFPIFAFL